MQVVKKSIIAQLNAKKWTGRITKNLARPNKKRLRNCKGWKKERKRRILTGLKKLIIVDKVISVLFRK